MDKTDHSLGAPVPEIEITPEMIEAGAIILERSLFDVSPTAADELAEEIIRAALKECR